MPPWSRLDARLLAVLLLSIFTPWAIAEDAPARRTALKLRSKIQRVSAEEERPSDQAAERWGQLKSRYSPNDDVRSTAARPVKHKRAASAPVRPIPEDVPAELSAEDALIDDDEWLADEHIAEPPRNAIRPVKAAPAPPVEEPVPVTGVDDEPAWIYGATAEVVQTADDVDEEEAVGAPPADDAGNDSAQEPISPARALFDDAPSDEPAGDPASAPRSASRRPRQIHEIQPTYDLNYDKDIREFARQQAKQYPVEFGGGIFPQRMFPGLMYQWEPSNFYHYPLYFEDAVLERYGHTYPCCIQPVVSIARFSGQLITLPYQMTLDPICCPKYVLGWYRPGECAPKLHYQPPLNAKAAAVEAGVVTGLFFVIP